MLCVLCVACFASKSCGQCVLCIPQSLATSDSGPASTPLSEKAFRFASASATHTVLDPHKMNSPGNLSLDLKSSAPLLPDQTSIPGSQLKAPFPSVIFHIL